ncbi:MAG: hypothetical protein GF344_19030 [Chitinivibrionales bacterium]|nr:hypothetical protein [Chitinivibrionales bacterium]MBD3358721.1 hypothetical protein [Chitinivibrionales bacterium]
MLPRRYHSGCRHMTTFSYTHIDPHGRRRVGAIEASDKLQAQKSLEANQLIVVNITEGDGGKKRKSASIKRRGKVSRREIIEFCIYMTTLTEAGLPITDALEEFEEETPNEYFRYVVRNLKTGVQTGRPLSEGLALFPKVFSREFVYLVRAAERTGTLPNAFRELRSYQEWLERLANDVKQATTYPIIIVIALGCFIFFLFSSVIPRITSILTDMRIELPAITRAVMGLSAMAVHSWYYWIAAGILIPVGIKIGITRSESFAMIVDRYKLSLPIFGGLFRIIIQARFAQNFAVLHRAGISILENLELCGAFIGNRVYARHLNRAMLDVRDGVRLSQSLKNSDAFSGLVLRMLAVGEATGNLDEALRHAAEYYNEEVPRRVKRLFSIMEPLIILILVGVIGVVAAAVFLPILSMSGGLG